MYIRLGVCTYRGKRRNEYIIAMEAIMDSSKVLEGQHFVVFSI